ncbi:MAG TPA: glycosyltransferase family 4 protein [Solirubrobacteraceae bacterium]|nr:glycosyltransferase family 4 protein [Solirubrobacteraceae bacterium]
MRVHIVDPSAYTPPYDHALCAALARAGATVDLYTSRFAHGEAPATDGYARHELFYRAARGVRDARTRRVLKLAEHVHDMLAYRSRARAADVVHFQWLAVQQLDAHLLPRGRPLVLTAHDILPREPHPGQLRAQRRLYERFDAIVVHSEHGRRRLEQQVGVPRERLHVIPHGALEHLRAGPVASPPWAKDAPVALFFGLLRPYKGLDVLIDAWRGIEGAELWVVGMARMDTTALHAAAPANVRFLERFVSEAELRACFESADVVVLPYREIDQSGVLFTALAFAKPLVLSDAGGFPEIAAAGAALTVPAGDARALHSALDELLSDRARREQMARCAGELARSEYSWDAIAARTLALYESLLQRESSA